MIYVAITVEHLFPITMLDKISVLIYLVSGAFAISTKVTVDGLGHVIGLQETTAWTNRTIYAFRGIPYAQPPMGDLRFRVSDSFNTVVVIFIVMR